MRKIGFGAIAFHTILTFLTGGLWLVVLGIAVGLKLIRK